LILYCPYRVMKNILSNKIPDSVSLLKNLFKSYHL